MKLTVRFYNGDELHEERAYEVISFAYFPLIKLLEINDSLKIEEVPGEVAMKLKELFFLSNDFYSLDCRKTVIDFRLCNIFEKANFKY